MAEHFVVCHFCAGFGGDKSDGRKSPAFAQFSNNLD
jgi:hypothetical protein